jgi:S-methylmethionine-dependent homocysteine/selenocysteine methylase
MMRNSLVERLSRPRPLLIDGAVGTELQRRGVPTTLPLWSAHALTTEAGLAVLRDIHRDYARAGAEVLVTDTFRTTLRALDRAGRGGEWRELNRRAVETARAASRESGATAPPDRGAPLIAGSIAPLEDCYRPDRVPPQDECLREHRRQVDLLAGLGVDFILIETMNLAREAEAALQAAVECGLEVVLSLCPAGPAQLLSGEPLHEVVPRLLRLGGERLRGVTLNCAPPELLQEIYPRLAGLVTDRAHGLYAHLGEPDATDGWKLPRRHEPQRYAQWMAARLREGARIVGGCCGTTPAHIAALAARLAPI